MPLSLCTSLLVLYKRPVLLWKLAVSVMVAGILAPEAHAQHQPARDAGPYPIPLAIDAAHPEGNVSSPVGHRGGGFVETFEADVFPPAGWTRFEYLGSDTQRWVLSNEGTNRFAYSRNSDIGSGILEDWLVTPLLSVTAGEQTLSFDMAQQYPALLGSAYTVAISTNSADQPTDFAELASWNEESGPEGQVQPPLFGEGLATYTLDLSDYVGQEVYIAFIHENDFGDSFILDNVVGPSAYAASAAPECIVRSQPEDGATNASAEALFLSWDPVATGEPATGYRIDIGTDPGAINIASDFDVGNATAVEIANGVPGTTYYYRIKPYNGLGPALGCPIVSFTTQGPAAAFPYTEDFDDNEACGLPAQWNLQRNAVSNEPWVFKRTMEFGAPEDHTTGEGCFAAIDDSVPDETPTSLLSPFFDFTSLKTPIVSFWFQNRRLGTQAPDEISTLYIDVSTDGGVTYTEGVGAFTARYQRWTKLSVDLSAYTTEPNVRLRFRGIEASPGESVIRSDISVDDVFVGESPGGAQFAIAPGSSGAYSFGSVAPCAGRERVFTIANDGTRRSTLNVSALRLDGDAAFSVVDVNPALPVILGENESVVLRIQFNPTLEGASGATLEVDYTVDAGAVETYSLALSGEGDALGVSSGEGAGYVWRNSSLCSTSSLGFEDIAYGLAAGDTEITAWDQGSGNDSYFALDLTPTIGSFRFFGEDYTTAYISSNGYIFFDYGSTSPGPPFPSTVNFENAYIAALGDDLNPSAGGAVSYRAQDTDSDGTDDELVVTYFRVPRFNFPSEYATFQVILRPSETPGANGTVKLQYIVGEDPTDGQALSQGFNNPNSFNADARVGITGDQGFASILYRDNGTGGVLYGGNSLAIEFAPRSERVIDASSATERGWRMLSAPASGMTVASLAEQNLVQGLPDEFPVDANGNAAVPNIHTSYSGNTGFRTPSGLDEVLTPGKGFIWYFFNLDYDPEVDANILTGDSESYLLPAPIVATGVENEADVSASLTSAPDGSGVISELLGNPFSSPLDITDIGSWTTGDLASSIGQVWDPATRCYVPTSTTGDVLEVWDGAFFENDTATEITYPISATRPPASSRQRAGRAGGPLETRRLTFELRGTASATGEATTDQATVLEFSEAATAGWDLRDATKLSPLSNTYAILAFGGERNGTPRLKAQESRGYDAAAFTVPLYVERSRVTGDFGLSWKLDEFPEGWQFTLTDQVTGQELDLRSHGTYQFGATRARGAAESDEVAEKEDLLHYVGRPSAQERTTNARFILAVRPPAQPTDVGTGPDMPERFSLGKPYPNPSSGMATISYALPEAVPVRLVVYDALGRRVAEVVHAEQGPGYHEVDWHPTGLPSGLYLVRLDAGARRFVQKLTLVD